MKLLSLALLFGALTTPLPAALYTYNIDGLVTNAPNSPGSFPENPWTFTSVPESFSGSFVADDTTPGSITNLSLVIGGIDVPALHPEVLINIFDPATLRLFWAGLDASRDTSFISLGNTTNTPGVPFDRAVATQNTDPVLLPPEDDIFETTINWEGTFAVSKGERVPESTTTFAAASLGFGGLLLLNALRGRRKRSRA